MEILSQLLKVEKHSQKLRMFKRHSTLCHVYRGGSF